LVDFPDGAKEVKKEQMYVRAFSKKVATTEQRHALEKVDDKRSELKSKASSLKEFIRKAIEP
jgi:hypothetical protein